MKKFYLTTTLPYVNADPHIGFALEMVQADAIVRYHKELLGEEVIFNTGTDEHGLKIYQKALEENKDPQAYCDEYAERFGTLKKALNLSYTHFIRTTNPDHKKAAQEFWKRCDANGCIDKKLYKIKYCVGCELEKTDSELEDGICPLHPKMKLQTYEEENYFFKFSTFQQKLLEHYQKNPAFVQPSFRLKEIKNFVESGLEDFSISRLKEKMPWGVDVPGDSKHVMYVWFDALINYISTLGWPDENSSYKDFWPGIQIAGKDNLRQQSAMWQAMLMAADLPNTKQIFIHGFITAEGHKMSKSLGNVVNPHDLVEKYGTDAVRYYLLGEIPSDGDGDYSEKRFKELYNADLANGLGNLVARITKLAEGKSFDLKKTETDADYRTKFERFKFNEILALVWEKIRALDKYINETKPWSITAKDESHLVLSNAVNQLNQIAFELQPFLPQTSRIILDTLKGKVVKPETLFPRL